MAAVDKNCVDCGAPYVDRSRRHGGLRCADCAGKRNRALAKERNANKTATEGYWTADTLRRKYGWTIDDFDEQLATQGGACAVCGATEPGGHGRWHVDHDHDSGSVRGILCHHCNLSIGNARDSAELLRAMAEYLSR